MAGFMAAFMHKGGAIAASNGSSVAEMVSSQLMVITLPWVRLAGTSSVLGCLR